MEGSKITLSINTKRSSFYPMRLRRVLPVLLILILFVPAAYAQLYTSNIVGTVTDVSGGVVPGAKVTLLNINTGVQQSAQTNSAGDYVF
ncbi:MAG: carboxypeptidase-like regulatory domain-containing protein, partial [Terriglobia bacterium]